MHPLTLLSFFLTSLISSTLGSPLKIYRRRVIETLTVTNTVTTSTTVSVSVPFATILPTAVPTDPNLPLSGVTATPANASSPEPVTASPVGIFPTAVPTTLSILPLFPPTVPSPTTTSSSSSTSIPIFPTAVPTAKSPEDTARCTEYCKKINWDPAACQSNCHIINGQIQLDAPGVLIFPPTAPYPSSTISSTSTSTRTTTTTSPSSTPSSAPLVLGPFSSGGTEPGRGQMKAVPLTAEAKAKGIINAVARNCQVKCLGKPGYAACVSQCELEKFLPRLGRVML